MEGGPFELCQDARVIEQKEYVGRRRGVVRSQVIRHGRGTIGMLHVTGTLKMGDSIPGTEGMSACGAAALTRDLKELRERDDIGAVVLRISSPGGSGLASDLVWHEVERTRAKKPVVISFGSHR